MDRNGIYTESQTIIFWCTCNLWKNTTLLLNDKLKFQLRYQMNSTLGLFKKMIWVPWLLKTMLFIDLFNVGSRGESAGIDRI